MQVSSQIEGGAESVAAKAMKLQAAIKYAQDDMKVCIYGLGDEDLYFCVFCWLWNWPSECSHSARDVLEKKSLGGPGGITNGKFVTLTPFIKNRPKSMKTPHTNAKKI
jgi:hypothetical protein